MDRDVILWFNMLYFCSYGEWNYLEIPKSCDAVDLAHVNLFFGRLIFLSFTLKISEKLYLNISILFFTSAFCSELAVFLNLFFITLGAAYVVAALNIRFSDD